MANFTHYPSFLANKATFTVPSDFTNFATGTDGWTSLAADGGSSVSVGDARGGIAALATGATDNNECALYTTNELFLFSASRPGFFRVRLNFEEQNTDDANIFVGFASATDANLMVDDGAGMRTTGSIIGIFKVDGASVWRCYAADGTNTRNTATTYDPDMSSGVYQELEVQIQEFSTSECVITYLIDGVYLRDDTSYANVIEHRLTYSNLTEMELVACYVKAGDANSETPNVDWVVGAQVR